jgi:hypothetical protein
MAEAVVCRYGGGSPFLCCCSSVQVVYFKKKIINRLIEKIKGKILVPGG